MTNVRHKFKFTYKNQISEFCFIPMNKKLKTVNETLKL